MKFLAILAIFFTAVSAAPLIDVDADVNADVDVDLGRGFNRKGGDGNNEFGNSQSCGGTDSGNGDDDDSSRNVCPGRLYSEPQCCVTNTANVLDLDCRAPEGDLNDSVDTFRFLCHGDSRKAMCCAVPVAGQALLCQEA